MRIAVIGGGAAGFFAAITAKKHCPESIVVLLEAGSKVLSKVRISGGGRCNVTHACFDPVELATYYPRGAKPLRQAFSRFMTGDTVAWFEEQGVLLKTEADGRMFPVTDDSQTIVDCLTGSAVSVGVEIRLHASVGELIPLEPGFRIVFRDGSSEDFDRVLVATGGQPKLVGFNWLVKLGHTVVAPVPSLFTFNIPDPKLTSLMGVSVNPVTVELPAERLSVTGPLLITHWGLSGPAVLKLSSLGARKLAERNYSFEVSVNWSGSLAPEQLSEQIAALRRQKGAMKVNNAMPLELPRRLWEYLLERSGVRSDVNWQDLRKDELDRLCQVICKDSYAVIGKTTFKDEFVTCGGIELSEVDFRTMQSKRIPGLYFAGEVLDIDGLTGGFNFQAAWTTGYLAGMAMATD
ncbi:MAG: hypothetical protein RL021_2081 [Bacteroidota bacterium]|jgi:predicted Rossmann fold flavoprotein